MVSDTKQFTMRMHPEVQWQRREYWIILQIEKPWYFFDVSVSKCRTWILAYYLGAWTLENIALCLKNSRYSRLYRLLDEDNSYEHREKAGKHGKFRQGNKIVVTI